MHVMSVRGGGALLMAALVLLSVVSIGCQATGPSVSSESSPGLTVAPSPAGEGSSTPGVTFEWRMNISHPPGDVKTQFADEFADLLDQRTGGRIRILTFAGSTLMPSADSARETAAGTVPLDANGNNFYEPIVPFLSLWTLPFFGLETTQLRHVIEPGSRGREIVDGVLARSGLKLLALWDAGSLGLVSSDQITTADSLRGKTIRVSGALAAECVRAAGAEPVSMSGSEAVDAMRRNVIDASTIEVASVKTRGYHEFAKYWVDWRLQSVGFGLFMNLNVWQSLPSDLQQTILEVASDVEGRGDAASLAAQQDVVGELGQAGFTVLDVLPGERENVREGCSQQIESAIAAIQPADEVQEFLGLMTAAMSP